MKIREKSQDDEEERSRQEETISSSSLWSFLILQCSTIAKMAMSVRFFASRNMKLSELWTLLCDF